MTPNGGQTGSLGISVFHCPPPANAFQNVIYLCAQGSSLTCVLKNVQKVFGSGQRLSGLGLTPLGCSHLSGDTGLTFLPVGTQVQQPGQR